MNYRRFSTFIEKVQYGYTAEKTSPVEGDAKYLRITDIVPYFVDKDRVPFCNISDQKKKQYLVKENDLLIARTGATTGYNLIVPRNFENFIFASYLVRYYYNQKELYPLYLKYVLKSQQYYGFVNNYIGGSAQPGMNPKAFGRFMVPFFEYEYQKKIASALSTYDNLIENNNNRIKILEQMAENLYKEWFVRFRFPGHETTPIENGIPQGWKKGILSEICCFLRGKNITSSEMVEGPYPVIAAGLEPSGYHNETNVNGVSITISNSGANAGYISIHYSDIWAADCSYVSELKTENIFFVYEMLRNLSSVITNLQRGAAQPHVYAKDVNDLKMYLPPKELMNKANTQFRAIHQQISALTKQNDLLIKQRDLLLPRLMSGKLAV